MGGKAWGCTKLRMWEIGCRSRWEPVGTGIATPDVLLKQSFKNITYVGRAFNMKGALAVMASALEHAGHFTLLYKKGWGGGWDRVGSRSMSDGARGGG